MNHACQRSRNCQVRLPREANNNVNNKVQQGIQGFGLKRGPREARSRKRLTLEKWEVVTERHRAGVTIFGWAGLQGKLSAIFHVSEARRRVTCTWPRDLESLNATRLSEQQMCPMLYRHNAWHRLLDWINSLKSMQEDEFWKLRTPVFGKTQAVHTTQRPCTDFLLHTRHCPMFTPRMSLLFCFQLSAAGR